MGITVAPYKLSNSQNSFLLESDGFVAGTFLDNPANRYQLEGGVVASAQSTPLWGGIPVSLAVPAPGIGGSSSGLGPAMTAAATSGANIDAWCVFNQASAGVITASSNVPLYPANTSANFVRVGSGLWVVLPVKAADVNTIAGGTSLQTLYWDFTNNYVTVTAGTGPLGVQIIALNTNSKVVTYNSGSGAATWTAGGSVIVVRV